MSQPKILVIFLIQLIDYAHSSTISVPIIEWSNFSLLYPTAGRSTGCEIYNDTLFGIGGIPIASSAVINWTPLSNLFDTSISSTSPTWQYWTNYTWQDEYVNITNTTYSYTRFSVTGSTSIDNLLYLTGIEGKHQMLIFDMESKTQISMNTYNFSYPFPVDANCAVNNGSHIFVLGGRTNGGDAVNQSKITRIYNPITDEWILGANMNKERSFFACDYDELNDKIWVYSGRVWPSGGLYSDKIEYYDIRTDIWTVLESRIGLSNIQFPRGTHASMLWTSPTDSYMYDENSGGINRNIGNYYKQYSFIFGGYASSRDYYTEILSISVDKNNLSESEIFNYTLYGEESDLPYFETLINPIFLPEKYNVLNISYTILNNTHWEENIYYEKIFLFIGGQTDIPGYVYLKNIWKGAIKYNDSIVISAPTMNPTTLPTGIPSGAPSSAPSYEPSINPSTQPSSNPTVIPSINPSVEPTLMPSSDPVAIAIGEPTSIPSNDPSVQLMTSSRQPSVYPSTLPTAMTTETEAEKTSTTGDSGSGGEDVTTTEEDGNGNGTGGQTSKGDTITLDISTLIIIIMSIVVCCLIFAIILLVISHKKQKEKIDVKNNKAIQLSSVGGATTTSVGSMDPDMDDREEGGNVNSHNGTSPNSTDDLLGGHGTNNNQYNTIDFNTQISLPKQPQVNVAGAIAIEPEIETERGPGHTQQRQDSDDDVLYSVKVAMANNNYNINNTTNGGLVNEGENGVSDNRNINARNINGDMHGGGGGGNKEGGVVESGKQLWQGWRNWTKKELADWLENELLKTYGEREEDDRIQLQIFMKKFRNASITADLISIAKKTQNWNALKLALAEDKQERDKLIGLFLAIQFAVESLP